MHLTKLEEQRSQVVNSIVEHQAKVKKLFDKKTRQR